VRTLDPIHLDRSRGFPTYLRSAEGALLAEVGDAAFARRLHACLAACRGIATEDLETAGRLAVAEDATLRRLQEDSDDLLAALRRIAAFDSHEPAGPAAMDARKAIAGVAARHALDPLGVSF